MVDRRKRGASRGDGDAGRPSKLALMAANSCYSRAHETGKAISEGIPRLAPCQHAFNVWDSFRAAPCQQVPRSRK